MKGNKIKKVWLTFLAILIFFSTLASNSIIARAAPIFEGESVPVGTELTVTPSLQGTSVWYFDGYTDVVDSSTNSVIASTYRYKNGNGQTVTMINPGSIGEWADAIGGERHQVIAEVSGKKYKMDPGSPKQWYERIKIDDVISASGVKSEYKNGKIYVTPPGKAPKVTKFAFKEPLKTGAACYPINSTVNIDIEVQEFSDNSSTLKYVEVYAKDKNSASTLKKWDNVSTDSNGKVSLTVPYKVTMEEKVTFYIRAYDNLNRFDQDTTALNNSVGTITPVGLNIDLCGVVESQAGKDGTLPYYNHNILLKNQALAGGELLLRVDDTAGQHVLGRYRYPTLYDGKYGSSVMDKSTLSKQNTSFKVEVPFTNTGVDRSYIASAYQGQAFYHLVNQAFSTARNVIDIDRVSSEDFKTVYNGNPDYMGRELPEYQIINSDTRETYGNGYYYIRDLARLAGGAADNVTGNDQYNSINPTWLRVLRTDWPDITTFALNQKTVKIGDTVSFTIEGYEYVSEDRNKADTRITITKADGSTVGSPILKNLKSDKSKKNPKKPNQEEAGYWVNENVPGFKITEKGSYTAELYMEDSVKRYASKKITFKVGCAAGDTSPECTDKPVEPSGPACEVTITINNPGTNAMTGNNLLANPTGVIKESHESAEFDVLKYGIPSSEYLQASGESEKYISEFAYNNPSGTVTYNVNVKKKYALEWEEVTPGEKEGEEIRTPQSEEEEVTQKIQDVYPISYWTVNFLKVLKYDNVTIQNYALPNGSINIVATFDVTGTVKNSTNVEDHVFPVECKDIDLGVETIDGGESKPAVPKEDFTASAQIGSRTPQVKNDFIEVDGTIYMDDNKVPSNGPKPIAIAPAPRVTISQSSYQIEPTKINKRDTSSSLTAQYKPVPSLVVNTSANNMDFTGTSAQGKINTVTVHTPTVMYASASDDKAHDQRTDAPDRSTPANPNTDRHAFILDRPFTVKLSTQGKHLDTSIAPGYGDRDYGKAQGESCTYNGTACKQYTKDKQIRFPFDVYTETKSGFYPANTWISVPLDIDEVKFFLPVWVPEGEYKVDYRSIAINSPSYSVISEEAQKEYPEANLNTTFRTPDANMDHHMAYDSIEVDVVGRLYDLHVTDITDYNWQSVFRESDGITHNGASYWVGQNDIDGALRGNSSLYTLPVRHGSHPKGYSNVAVKKGYAFRFDLKTKGNMFGSTDALRIKPTFYFVNKDGTGRKEIDLYYHDKQNYFVRVGSDEDKTYREIKLNEPARSVPDSELIANADFYYRHADKYGLSNVVSEYYAASYARMYLKHFSKEDVQTGPYGWQVLNWNLRTFIGPEENEVPVNTMVPPNDIVAREQTWYGEYSLPANLYAVEKGSNIADAGLIERLNENHPMFLKDGYIIVNFDIESIRDGNVDNPYLQYINAENMNQWFDMEGFKRSFVDNYGNTFNLNDGDVIFYHGDSNSDSDMAPSVTH